MLEGKPAYRPELDGLRAIAVVAVILFHAGLGQFKGGFVGVDIFFVISGYLIARRLSDPRTNFASFVEDRARRILPALFVLLLLLAPIVLVLLPPQPLQDFGREALSSILFVSNFYFFRSIDYFHKLNGESLLIHTWSLSLEVQLYVFFAVLWAVARSMRMAMPATFVIAVASLYLCITWSFEPGGAAFYLPQSRFWQFLAGVLCLAAESRWQFRGNAWLAAAGLALIVFSILAFTNTGAYPGYRAALPVLGTVLIILFSGGDTLLTRAMSIRPLVFMGLTSYSAYLYHQPVFALARLHFASDPDPRLMLALGVVSLFPAWLSWRFVELPFRKRQGAPAHGLGLLAGGSLLALLAVGITFALTEHGGGLRFRYDSEQWKVAAFNRKAATEFVRAQFERRARIPFPDNGKPNVFIVGDSYGQDLVNALVAAGIAEQINISTHHISKECGNLLIERDFSNFITEKMRESCRARTRYDSPEIMALLKAADTVILASSWLGWQVPMLAESIANIGTITDAKLFVFGIKNLGNVSPSAFVHLSPEAKAARIAEVEPRITINRNIAEAAGDAFFDLQGLICGGGPACPLFTDDGYLISFDGSHLTREGAAFVGARLAEDPRISALLR